jgi:hypothetical protein
MTYTSASGSKPTLPPPPYAPADFERGVTGREAWAPERRDKVEDSKRKDNARTKNHENSCGHYALPITMLSVFCGPGGRTAPSLTSLRRSLR